MGRGATPDASASRNLGLVLLAGVTIAWGISWPINKIVVNEIEPLTSRALIVPASAVILLLFARLTGRSLAVPRRRWPWLVVVSLFNITGFVTCVVYAVTYMAAGRAVIIAYTMPLWASILGVFILGEAMTRRRVGALALGMGGLGILLWGEMEAVTGAPIGGLFALGAAVSWAIGTVLTKHVDWRTPPLALAGWQLAIGGLPILLAMPAVDDTDFGAVSAAAVLGVVFLTLGPMSFCYWAFFKVLNMFSAGATAIGTLLSPIVGVLGAAIMLGEVLGWRETSALVLVCGALALELRRPAVAAPS